jgi:hypothetical protein
VPLLGALVIQHAVVHPGKQEGDEWVEDPAGALPSGVAILFKVIPFVGAIREAVPALLQVELSPSNRAGCRKCGEKIDKVGDTLATVRLTADCTAAGYCPNRVAYQMERRPPPSHRHLHHQCSESVAFGVRWQPLWLHCGVAAYGLYAARGGTVACTPRHVLL